MLNNVTHKISFAFSHQKVVKMIKMILLVMMVGVTTYKIMIFVML